MTDIYEAFEPLSSLDHSKDERDAHQIAWLEGEVRRLRDSHLSLAGMTHHLVLAMQAAWIEWKHGRGIEAGMAWIENTLDGPDMIPQEDAGTDAQAFFDRERDAQIERERQARSTS